MTPKRQRLPEVVHIDRSKEYHSCSWYGQFSCQES